jgi:hypothetical protein
VAQDKTILGGLRTAFPCLDTPQAFHIPILLQRQMASSLGIKQPVDLLVPAIIQGPGRREWQRLEQRG